MMRAALLAVVLVSVVLAGCLGGSDDTPRSGDPDPVADFSHLSATGATITDDNDSRIFSWTGSVGPGTSVPLLGPAPGADVKRHTFEVDGAVGYVEARVESTGGLPLLLVLRDDEDRIVCAAIARAEPSSCTGPVPTDSKKVEYAVTVQQNGGDGAPETVAYDLALALFPPWLLPHVDMVEELDPTMTFFAADTGFEGGEPTLGVTSDGTIFAIEGTTVARSKDDGKTWEDVTPVGHEFTLDPMMTVDPWTDRVYVNHLYVACSYLSWSDDKGETWITNPAACGNTAIDHQKITVGGAFGPGIPYDGTVYFSYNSFALLAPNAGHIVVSRSLDGGVTWTPSVAVTEALDYNYRTGGPIAADRDGNVYIPMYLNDGGFGVAVSNDHGLTWNAVRAGEKSGANEGIDPGLAIDTAGNAYGAYWGPEGVRVTHSTDKGKTWSDTVVVSAPSLKSFVLADATAGDEGRVAVAYLATPDTDKGPNAADGFAKWHLYVSYTEDALADEPVWKTVRATSEDDPVQIGSICTGGIGCFGGNRNLLDFIDIQPGPDGRIYVAYTDGCTEDCESPQTSRERQGFVAVQVDGPRLFEEKAPWVAVR